MPTISEQSFVVIVFINNGCKLLTIFHKFFKEPVKVVLVQKVTNQSGLNGGLVIELINNSFCESNKKVWFTDDARNILIKKKLWAVRIHVQNSKGVFSK